MGNATVPWLLGDRKAACLEPEVVQLTVVATSMLCYCASLLSISTHVVPLQCTYTVVRHRQESTTLVKHFTETIISFTMRLTTISHVKANKHS